MIPLPLVIESEEGGKTLFRPDLDETYHSKHGAIQESLHVFIKEGLQFYLDHRSKRNIAILEMGFGTGLNAMLTYLETKRSDLTIHYCGLESEKLPFDLVQNLGYEKHWGKELQDAFEQMHTSNWDQSKAISELFSLEKKHIRLEDFKPEQKFDLIYFDAFGPDKQAELWTLSIFEKLYTCMNEEGVLVTYSAKGEVRRNLIAAGFTVSKIEGPPHKRHMLRAIKNTNS